MTLAVVQRAGAATSPSLRGLVDLPLPAELPLASLALCLTAGLRTRDERIRSADAGRGPFETRDLFLALLSHDLRTPLSVVLGQCQLLQEGIYGPCTTAQLLAISRIVRQGERMGRMVEDLLNHYRSGKGPLDLKLGPVELNAVVREGLDRVADVAYQRGVSLRTPDGQETWVCSERVGLEEVLGNLVENAVRFSSPGDAVRVSVELVEDGVFCHVDDQGPGFPADFRPGEVPVGGAAPKRLGLSLSRVLLGALGGRLVFGTSPEGGARASVWLPRICPSTGEGSDPDGCCGSLAAGAGPGTATLKAESVKS
ncbi:MAG: HAMP domain-containing histidine kinase [Alphaproteobacteria bacterium]|nr:HAMP domain-containing histidine kinase [Alphaproteobacteria bacterium]